MTPYRLATLHVVAFPAPMGEIYLAHFADGSACFTPLLRDATLYPSQAAAEEGARACLRAKPEAARPPLASVYQVAWGADCTTLALVSQVRMEDGG